MGWMELWNAQHRTIELTETSWYDTLERARAHGWEPAGTLLVGAGQREYTGYLPVWLQRVVVRAPDALALADALDRARVTDDAKASSNLTDGIVDLCRLGSFCVSTRQVDTGTVCFCDYDFATSPERG